MIDVWVVCRVRVERDQFGGEVEVERAEVGKFFHEADALAFEGTVAGRTDVVARQEREEDQHWTHRGLGEDPKLTSNPAKVRKAAWE